MTIFRSENIYRSMSALTSLVYLSTANELKLTAPFFVAVSEVEAFISHVDALVDALDDSNPEKQCFRALVRLGIATSYLYERNKVPDGFAHDIRKRLIQLLNACKYVLPSLSVQDS